MKLTVLGKYGPYPKAGGACSSYLLFCGKTKILLDAGNGSFSNLQKHTDYRDLDAIILSHLHSDHISDLLVMRYALQNVKAQPILLYLPRSPKNMYDILKSEKAFQSYVIDENMKLDIGGAEIVFKQMTHSVDSYAVKVLCGQKTLVYSGDTNMNTALAGFSNGADALLCDAAFSNNTLPKTAPHLSAAQAAAIAKEAGVKKLYLTHISPQQEESVLLKEAASIFKNTEITVENQTITI